MYEATRFVFEASYLLNPLNTQITMKKRIRILMIYIGFFPALLLAAANASSNPFSDNPAQWDKDLEMLTQLEQMVDEKGITLSQLKRENHPLAHVISNEHNLATSLIGATNPEEERLMDIPGFLWGFCCSFVGAFLVYLSIDDPVAKKREGSQAIIGCAVGTLLWVGLYVWLVISLSYN
ncbi:MAG TPA: hypothetical protein DCF33_21125 [Saprospirales bacterium]|nr:hypothetical protein [Saprospirales bacterium]